MPSGTEEHIDGLIRETLHRQMKKAGEPRPELMWNSIQKEIAVRERRTGFRHFLLTRMALFKWHVAGAAAVACLVAVTAFFPEQLTALGKRVFPVAPVVQQASKDHTHTHPAGGNPPPPEKIKMLGTDDATDVVPLPEIPPAEATEVMPTVETPDTAVHQTQVPHASRIYVDTAEARPRSRDQVATRQSDAARGSGPADAAARVFTVSAPENRDESNIRNIRRTAPFPVLYPTYLPSGFRQDDIHYRILSEQNGEVEVIFARRDKDTVICLTQQNETNGNNLAKQSDAKSPDSQIVEIRGREGHLSVTESEREMRTELDWSNGSMRYRILGDAEPEEIIKMAESLQP